MKIGVSGNVGSFSEEAANHYAVKNKLENFELAYLVSAERVLSDLTSGKIDLGIFPIENSNGGIVIEAVYAMAKYSFAIESLFEIDVKHFLHCKKGKTAEQIGKIVSHQQALKQCRMYLKRRWPDVELEEYADTAQAAKDLSEGKLNENVAVIAPERCAELYGLDILDESIQDLKFNFTTFVAAKAVEIGK